MKRASIFVVVVLALGLMVAADAVADTKVVRLNHTDGFSIMGQQRAAEDTEVVMWIGGDRLSRDDGTTGMVVRLDEKKMYVLDHQEQTASVIELPVDLDKLMPPEMAQMMAQMANFDIKVTPGDEVKTIGEWKARRYEVDISSQMMKAHTVMWIAEDAQVGVDTGAYRSLMAEMMSLQPGMSELAEQLQEIGGLDVMSETTTTMMGTEVASSEKVVSIETGDPPAGTYEVPKGYTIEPFDFAKMSQRR